MNQRHSLNNPFANRFDVPVRRRLDEMQSDAHMTWLRERNQSGSQLKETLAVAQKQIRGSRFVAGIVAILIFVVSLALVWKAV